MKPRMTFAQAVKVSGLTPEQVKKVQQAALVTWQAIGYDCLQANEGRSMPRSHVVEVVLDADHMLIHGNGHGRRGTGPLDEPTIKALVLNQPFDLARDAALEAIVTAAFTADRYGM